MKYFIAYLLTGEAEKAHNHLTGEIERKFGLVRTSPPHITLKYPFETDSIWEIEDLLADFAKTRKKAKILFKGFGFFENEVIYADVKPSSEAVKLISEFDDALQRISWLAPGQFEKNRKLHATLADKGNIKKIFTRLWDFATLGSFGFEAWMDNIAILKKENGVWKIYKKFELK